MNEQVNSWASVPRLQNGLSVVDHVPPMVLRDGTPDSALQVTSFAVRGPLDERELEIDASAILTKRSHGYALDGAKIIAVQAHRLIDECIHHRVLASGMLRDARRVTEAGREKLTLRCVDTWSERLSQRMDSVWRLSGNSDWPQPLDGGRLRPDDGGNRSAVRHDIHGKSVYIIDDRPAAGHTWDVGSALEMLSAHGKLHLNLTLLPEAIARSPLLSAVDLDQPMRDVLMRIFKPYDLALVRELRLAGGRVQETRVVRPMNQGRAIRVIRSRLGEPAGKMLRVRAEHVLEASQQWIAQGSGWTVESTFALVHGWPAALAGASDATYGRTTSSDFARYRDVYRLWVLNEDGYFSSSPFGQQAFDLAEFFEDSQVQPQPLTFGPCVVLDEAGRRQRPLVEMSVDGGNSWASYPGRAVMLVGRAGVYLDDDVLPSTFLAAAQAGLARMRVTASLTSPASVQVKRWRGNAFAGTQRPHVLDGREAFAFRRVGADSKHRAAVDSGSMSADVVDSSRAMERWLVQQMLATGSQSRQDRGEIVLSGAWDSLRVGDRLVDANLTPLAAAGHVEPLARGGAIVQDYRCRWGDRVDTTVNVQL